MRSFWLLGALCLFAASSAAQEIGKVRFLAGPVTVSRAGAISNAAAGDSLRANDIVRTGTSAGNGARIVLLDASELTLGPGTELRIVVHNPDTQQTTIEMLHGHLRAKVTPVVKQGGIFQVRTPTAIAVALGTVMQVDTVETTVATTGTTLSQKEIENLPGNGRSPADLVAVLPATAGPATTERIRGLANNSILDGNSDSANVTGSLTLPPSDDAISSLSVTSLYTGVVSDAVSNASGGFETSALPSGPYNIRISLKNGTNSFQAHGFELYGGTHVNFFNTPPAGQPSASGRPGWDFSIAPSYDLKSPRSSAIWQQRFPTLPSFSAYPPPSGMSFSSGGELASGGFSGASNFFNPQTQTYNALTPFTVSNPFFATGSQSFTLNYSPGATRPSPQYSRSLQQFSSGPIFMPRFGEGSNFGNSRASRSNYFFLPPAVTTPSPETPVFDWLHSTGLPGRGFKLGMNYTFDPYLRSSNQFSYTHTPQTTDSKNLIGDFGAEKFTTNFAATVGNLTQHRSRIPSTAELLHLTPPPVTDPRVSHYEYDVIFGWVPIGFDGGVVLDARAATDTAPSVSLNNFNWDLHPLPQWNDGVSRVLLGTSSTGVSLALSQGVGERRTLQRAEYARYADRSPYESLNPSRGIRLSLGSSFSQPYKTGNSGDEIATLLENPSGSSRLSRNLGLQTSKYREEFRLPLSERFSEPYISFPKHSKYHSYQFAEIPDRALLSRSRYALSELEISPRVSRAMIGETGYKYSDSRCYSRSSKYGKYDYKLPWRAAYVQPKEFYGVLYGYKQPIAPAFARSLDDIQPGLTQRASGRFGLWDYPGVTITIVIALDHWVAVAGYATGSRTQYAQSGHMIIVRANQAAERSVAIMNFNGTVPTFQQASLKNFPTGESLFRAVPEFNAAGTCVATYLLNGVVLFGGSPTAVTYKLFGTGSSTGQVIRVLVTNNTNCAIYFMVSFGAVLQPHSLEHKIGAAISLLLGNNLNVNNIKSYQIMINFGGTTIAIIVVPPPSPPQHPSDMGGHVAADAGSASESASEQLPPNVAEGFLRSYCLELHKLAPHPETRYDFADAKLQEELGPNSTFLQHIFEMVQSGALKIPPGHSLDSLIQWTLWASREGMDESKFMDAYMTLVHHNYDAQKRKWDKDAQKQMEESGKGLWPAVAMALAAK